MLTLTVSLHTSIHSFISYIRHFPLRHVIYFPPLRKKSNCCIIVLTLLLPLLLHNRVYRSMKWKPHPSSTFLNRRTHASKGSKERDAVFLLSSLRTSDVSGLRSVGWSMDMVGMGNGNEDWKCQKKKRYQTEPPPPPKSVPGKLLAERIVKYEEGILIPTDRTDGWMTSGSAGRLRLMI